MGTRYWTGIRAALEEAGHSFPSEEPERVSFRHETDGTVLISLTHSRWAAPVAVKVDGELYQRASQAAAKARKQSGGERP